MAPGTREAPFRPHLLAGGLLPAPKRVWIAVLGHMARAWPQGISHGAFPAVAPRSGKRRGKTQTRNKWSCLKDSWKPRRVRWGAAAQWRCVGQAAPVPGWLRGRRGPGAPGRAAAGPAHSWPGRRARRAPCASSWLRAGRSERRELGEEPGPAAAALPVIGLLCCNFARPSGGRARPAPLPRESLRRRPGRGDSARRRSSRETQPLGAL